MQRSVLAMYSRAVEASGDVDVLLLDKTGTITLGNRQAAEFLSVNGVEERELAEVAARVARNETPEGRSIVVRKGAVRRARAEERSESTFVPFSATTRMSGVEHERNADPEGRRRRGQAGPSPSREAAHRRTSTASFQGVAEQGGTPLVVARDNWALGVIHLQGHRQGRHE